MVGRPYNFGGNVGERNPNTQEEGEDIPQRIIGGHNIEHQVIRSLIQGALDPLEVDPVPDEILIKNIVITRNSQGQLDISCQVNFERRVEVGEGTYEST